MPIMSCEFAFRLSHGFIKPFKDILGHTGLSKQCTPRSDATERGVWSGSALFATHPVTFIDTSTASKMVWFKFYNKYGKKSVIRIQGKYGVMDAIYGHDASRKHAYTIWTPLNPTFIYKNWGIHNFSCFCSKNIDRGYSLEPPRGGGSNEYPRSMFWAEIWKISEYLSELFHFLELKFQYIWIGVFS